MIESLKQEYKLSDLCEIKYGKDYKKLNHGNVPLYGSGGLMGHVDSFLYEGSSVLIPRKGTISNLFFAEGKFWTVDTLFWTKIDEKIVEPRYLYYVLKNTDLESMNVGSAVPSLTTKELNQLILRIPDLTFQKRVSNFLSSLDDKIEINNKINSNLEELAQTLYKRWFVDFEFPNEEGKPYKSSGGEMVESELGMIPKGWEISQLSEFIFEAGKRTKPSSETINNPYVPIDCITSKSLTLWEYKDGEEAKSSLISFKAGDILFGAMRPYFHKVCIAPFDGTTRSTCLVLNSKHEDYFYFSTLTLFLESTIQFATQNSTGSTIPYISWKNGLGSLIVAVPASNVAARFNSILNPVFEKLLLGAHENRSLIETRDLLLPKLMSGEIEV